MTGRQDDEEQPLLGERRVHGHTAAVATTRRRLAQTLAKMRSEWPLIKTLLVATIAFLFYFGKQGYEISSTRDLACAAYYGLHPDEIGSFDGGNVIKACSPSSVEAFTAEVQFYTDVLGTAVGSMAIVFYGSKLSEWGRKPVLIIGILSEVVLSATFVLLPKSYPFGPVASTQLDRSPSWLYPNAPLLSLAILFAMVLVYALLGTELIITSAIRVLITDVSSTAERTRNYLFLTITSLIGLTFGPILLSLCAAYFPINRSTLLATFEWRRHNPVKGYPHLPPSGSHPPGEPLPMPDLSEHNNISPLLFVASGLSILVVAVYLFVDETVPQGDTDEHLTSTGDGTKQERASAPSTLSIFLPRRHPSDGLLDWRITLVALTEAFTSTTNVGLTTLSQYGSYRLGWTGEDIGVLISSIGFGRGFALALFVPAVLFVLNRYTKKPAGVRHLSREEIRKIADSTPAATAPEEDDTEDADESHHLKGLVSLWKARIDLHLAQFSYILDGTVWLFISYATSRTPSDAALFFGISLLQLGVGAQAALHSIGVTVTVDSLDSTTPLLSSRTSSSSSTDLPTNPTTRAPQEGILTSNAGTATPHVDNGAAPPSSESEEERGKREEIFHKQATAQFFALISLVDGLTLTFVKILVTAVYVETLDAAPWLPFFLFAIFQALALLCVSAIQVHR